MKMTVQGPMVVETLEPLVNNEKYVQAFSRRDKRQRVVGTKAHEKGIPNQPHHPILCYSYYA